MEHPTPLKSHFKEAHIWWDLFVLALLYGLAAYFPVIKIIPLVASLELIGFISFHLFAKHHSVKLQGFWGGFISSTAVFLQMLNDPKFSQLTDKQLFPALLLALLAMLVECILILAFFSSQTHAIYYLPFILQGGFFIVALFLLNLHSPKNPSLATIDLHLEIDHPILWKNVAKLSLLIFAIVTVMHFISTELGFSREISTLLISFFEAHAVLAATLSDWSLHPQNIDLLLLILVILFGNTCSKSFLIYQGKNLRHKKPFILLLFGSYAITLAISLAVNHIAI